MKDKRTQKTAKGPSLAQLRLYDRLRRRGRMQGCPRDENLWLQILDLTNGRGLRPDRRSNGAWQGLEEFLDAVPPILRNYEDGLTLDDVAQMLGMDSEYDLTKDLSDSARCRWARQYGRRGYDPTVDFDEDADPGEPYHPGEEDEWPDWLPALGGSEEVPF